MQAHTHRKLSIIIGAVASLGAITAVLAYIDSRRDKQLKSEVLAIEKQLKELQLYRAQNGHS